MSVVTYFYCTPDILFSLAASNTLNDGCRNLIYIFLERQGFDVLQNLVMVLRANGLFYTLDEASVTLQ